MNGRGPDNPADWVEMRLRGLILDPQNEAPVVILREEGGSTFLPIWIGVFEAQAIALALEKVALPRPMTHDLLGSAIVALGGALRRVEIHTLQGGTYFARLILDTGSGTLEVDARPSDAIALALRAPAPIWTARTVLADALASAKATDSADEERLKEWLANAKPEDLGKYSM
jgi:bifunctional DNase/RNase